jgi:hypothetical protein
MIEATPGPSSATALNAARAAILAALAESDVHSGYQAAKAALTEMRPDDMLDVAAILALLVGRPDDMLLLTEEFAELVQRWVTSRVRRPRSRPMLVEPVDAPALAASVRKGAPGPSPHCPRGCCAHGYRARRSRRPCGSACRSAVSRPVVGSAIVGGVS